jgi:hypothetical protein
VRFINKLEKKFGRFGIENLIKYIIFGQAIVYILALANVNILETLELNRSAILSGQVFRLVTFIFVPPVTYNAFFVFFALYFYYFIGTLLEKEWGTFKFNMYYFIGSVGAIIVCFATGGSVNNYYLNMSLFLALAMLYPNFQVRLFYILPIKIKYLALIDAVFILMDFFSAPIQGKILIIVLLANFIIFFGPQIVKNMKHLFKAKKSKTVYKSKVASAKNYYHKCHVCGRTELDDPNLEFRYCSKCEGNYEYCTDHLLNHEHIKKTDPK